MRTALLSIFVVVITAFNAFSDLKSADPDVLEAQQKITGLPIVFERNQGQYPDKFDFGSRTAAQAFMIRGDRAEIAVKPKGKAATNTGLSLVGAKRNPDLLFADGSATRVNYLHGNDPAKWIVGVPTYSRVAYDDVYPGVDVVYHGTGKQLEYDFVVGPGADPKQIRVRFDGVSGIDVENGDLLLRTPDGAIRHQHPIAYQVCDGTRRDVRAEYRVSGKNEIAFTVGPYDRDEELIIDPVIVFSAFFGGLGREEVFSTAVDAAGNIYMVGSTAGSPYLSTAAVLQTTQRDLADQAGVHDTWNDGFVTKFAAGGSSILFTTYIGGEGIDVVHGVAVDGTGRAIIGGETRSRDFPTTPGSAFPSLPNGFGSYKHSAVHGFVARLDPSGSALTYSSYLGADTYYTEERVIGVAADTSGNAWVVGETRSPRFPTTPGAYQTELTRIGSFPIPDAFVTKLNPTGGLVYSTYLGGRAWDRADSVAVDSSGNAYVRTRAYETSFSLKLFPVTPGAYKPDGDYYVTKLDASGSNLIYSTGLGGDTDRRLDIEAIRTNGIAVDSSGFAYITGYTDAPNFPTSPGAFMTSCGATTHAFVTKLNQNGTAAVYSTYLNGTTDCDLTFGNAIAVTPTGEAFVAGMTRATDFPAIQPLQPGPMPKCDNSCSASDDAFVTRFSGAGIPEGFSTTFGSMGPDEARAIALYGQQAILAGMNGSGFFFWSVGGPNVPIHLQQGEVFLAQINTAAAPPAGPIILGLSPVARSNESSQHISIRGHGFVEGATVTIGGMPPYTGADVVDSTQIDVNAISMPPGTYQVTVTNPNGATASKNGIRFATFPTLISCSASESPITPAQGPASGGTPIVIRGTGFQPGAVVTVGATLASSIQWISSTEIHAVTPPGRPAQSDVIVINPDGTYTSTINRCGWFTYLGTAPTVTSITPAVINAFAEHPVTIHGTNFAGSIIFENWTDVRVVDSTTITAISPYLAPGQYPITVRNDAGNSHTLPYALSVVPRPSVSPTFGPHTGGTRITITGAGFQDGARVFLDTDEEATDVDFIDANTLEATTPPKFGVSNGGYRPVTVVNPNGATFNFLNAFVYINNNGSVTVTGVTPSSGVSTGGETITVTGTGFANVNSMEILLGGFEPTDLQLIDANTLTMKTPPHIPGVVDIVVYVGGPGIPGAALQNAFTYVAGPPIVTGVTPGKGIPSGGTAVTVLGNGFAPGATVTFGGNALTNVQVLGATVLTGTTPAHALGPVTVTVTNPDTQSGSLPNGFTYGFPGLSLTPVAPTIMPGTSQTMTVTLDGTQGTDTVVSLTASNPSLITMPPSVTIPAGSFNATFSITAGPNGGTTDVTATLPANMGSIAAVANVTIPDAPIVTSFTPVMGTTGTVVTITGSRFTGAIQVKFGGVNAPTFTVDSNTQVTATAPENGITGPICITTPGPFTGCSSLIFKFPPRVTGFSPSTGAPGDVITINGVNLHDVTAVAFAGDDATEFTVNEAGTQITVTVPGNATTGPVTVTTPAGSGTSTGVFGVAPLITGFSPDRGGVGGAVTITGFRFSGATAVTFNGTGATFTVVNDTTINTTVPAGATTGPISVTTPGGTNASTGTFTVVATAAIASFSPIKGTPGTVVAIIGSNFTGTMDVTFNGTSASFTVENDNKIYATVPAAATNGVIGITTPLGTGFSTGIFYLPPVLSSFAPSAGSPGAGVVISGNNFIGATAVTFNGIAASFTVHAQNKIAAVVPETAATGTLTVTTPYGPVNSTFTFTVLTAGTPSVNATATGATTVSLVWNGTPGHTYQIRRITSKNGSFASSAIGTTTSLSFLDTTAAAGVTYLYNILDMTTGAIGNNDYATTIVFTDDPIVPRVTPVKALHLTQLRAAVNAVRVAAALPPASWTDPSPAGVAMHPAHISELRAKLIEALLALGRHGAFTDASLSAGVPVRTAHISELRDAVK